MLNETIVPRIVQHILSHFCEDLLLSQGCSNVQVCTPDDRCRNAKVNELFEYDNFARVPADVVEAGDICCLSGLDDVLVLFRTIYRYYCIVVCFSLLLKFVQWTVLVCSLHMLIFYIAAQIGETLADKLGGVALPTITVEEPTVRMSFSVNTSPFAGREVQTLVLIFLILSVINSLFVAFYVLVAILGMTKTCILTGQVCDE